MEHVVEELVLLVPERDALAGDVVHRARDVEEVLEELGRHVLVDGVLAGQFERDDEHVQAVHAHPGRAVRLLEVAAGRQRRAAVEDADVVEAEEAALEDVVPLGSLRFTHQVKLSSSFWKTRSRKARSARAGDPAVDLVDAPGRPGVDGRVDVAEGPFVGGQLAVRVHVPLARQLRQLQLGELGIDQRQRDAVEGEVPRGVPRVLPLVRHRDDVRVVEVLPAVVAPRLARFAAAAARPGRRPARRRHRSSRTACSRAARRTPAAARRAHRPTCSAGANAA